MFISSLLTKILCEFPCHFQLTGTFIFNWSLFQAIDIWTGVCLTFVFGALLEFALVNYASRNEDHRKIAKQRTYDLERAAALEAARMEEGPAGYGMVSKLQFLRTSCTKLQLKFTRRYNKSKF